MKTKIIEELKKAQVEEAQNVKSKSLSEVMMKIRARLRDTKNR